MGAEAEMLTLAEGEMAIGGAADVERVRFVEDRLVPVRRREITLSLFPPPISTNGKSSAPMCVARGLLRLGVFRLSSMRGRYGRPDGSSRDRPWAMAGGDAAWAVRFPCTA
jgi:hypothetical protein